MSKTEETNMLIDTMTEMVKEDAADVGDALITTLLMDIAKSLALIADCIYKDHEYELSQIEYRPLNKKTEEQNDE